MKTPKEWAEWTKASPDKSWVTFIREVQANAIEAAGQCCVNKEDEQAMFNTAAHVRKTGTVTV